MPISDAEYAEWLKRTDQVRALLLEGENDGETIYQTTYTFTSEPTDILANKAYCSFIRSVPELNSAIDGSATTGRIELMNPGGQYDAWLTRAWRGHPLRLYLGDPSWDRDDFREIVSGINGGITMPNQNAVVFSVRDKRELFTEPVQTNLMGDDSPEPLALGGTVFNAEPKVEDAALLIYRFHESGNASVTAVRDNGIALTTVGHPAGGTYVDNSDGTFTLGGSPAGRLTCDISGETTGTPAALVDWLAKRAPGIDASDIDSTNLSAFPATYTLSMYIRDSRTVAECVEDVVGSVGGAAYFTATGLLRIVRLEAPGTSVLSLGPDDTKQRGLSVMEIEEPLEKLTLGYKRNWTVQDPDSLADLVSAANRDLYSREHSWVTAENVGVTTDYPLAETPDPISTLIVSEANCQTEVNRRRTLRSTTRAVFKMAGFMSASQVELGETVNLTHPRYGFDSGVDAVVVGITQRPTRNRMILELWK